MYNDQGLNWINRLLSEQNKQFVKGINLEQKKYDFGLEKSFKQSWSQLFIAFLCCLVSTINIYEVMS
jgi:hypothetical protein